MNMMLDKEKLDMIRNAKPEEMSDLILAVQNRYNQLFPDWELSFYTLEKAVDKKEQLNQAIAMLQSMKNRL